MKTRYIIKRINAYLIDYIIVINLGLLVQRVIVPFDKSTEYQTELLDLIASGSTNYDKMLKLFDLSTENFDVIYFSVVAVSIVYYVILAKLLKDRTVGCMLTGQKIVKSNQGEVTLSDLTLKMFLTNGVVTPLVFALAFMLIQNSIYAALIGALFGFVMYCFLFINLIFLFVKGYSIVDIITKTRPMIVIKAKRA